MNARLRLLKSEIKSDLDGIAEAYARLNRFRGRLEQPDKAIVAGYYLNVIYGLFESMLRRIAALFDGETTDHPSWHAQLLRRMTLDVPDVRPAVIGEALYHSLDEMRRFRHLFRNAYILDFDPDRLAIALKHASRAEMLYQQDVERFLEFLDTLALGSDPDARL